MAGQDLDAELKAIQSVISALEPLDSASRRRVVGYAFNRLGIRVDESTDERPADEPLPPIEDQVEQPPDRQEVADVRTLRDEKQPKSANEMAAVVGYYLAELAPESEQKTELTTDDIKVYFKQANHPLPNVPRMTLPNAAAAGYFETLGGGRFRLNPVGHNLVAHNLPRKKQASARKRTPATKTKARAAKPQSKRGRSGKKPGSGSRS